jgi:hypothetical protein
LLDCQLIPISNPKRDCFEKIIENFSSLFEEGTGLRIWVRDGWFDLINEMLVKLHQYSKKQLTIQNCDEYPAREIKIHQIKEKFGKLRVTTNSSDGYVQLLISEAVEKALTTCEICGDGNQSIDSEAHSVRCVEHVNSFSF